MRVALVAQVLPALDFYSKCRTPVEVELGNRDVSIPDYGMFSPCMQNAAVISLY
jgi:hypothetical protein